MGSDKERSIFKKFIVFEGIDGSGTTTQAQLLVEALKEKGYIARFDFEPTDGAIGKKIRSILQKKELYDPLELAELFGEDRHHHLWGENGVKSFINDGGLVICDRYFYSSLAYQTIDLLREKVEGINQKFPYPEYLIFIDVPLEVGLKRVKDRIARSGKKETEDRFENSKTLSQVITRYHAQLASAPPLGQKRLIIEDGTKNIDDIHNQIWEFLKNLLI